MLHKLKKAVVGTVVGSLVGVHRMKRYRGAQCVRLVAKIAKGYFLRLERHVEIGRALVADAGYAVVARRVRDIEVILVAGEARALVRGVPVESVAGRAGG